MGYTLVTAFDHQTDEMLMKLTPSVNKIPFGRDGDREAANKVMKHHVTLIHWSKQYDMILLPKIEDIHFHPFCLFVTGSELINAEEGSTLLYFSVVPGNGFAKAKNELQHQTGLPVSDFLHITLAVDMDEQKLNSLKSDIDAAVHYPFSLQVVGLDLYHIWKPVQLKKMIRCYEGEETLNA